MDIELKAVASKPVEPPPEPTIIVDDDRPLLISDPGHIQSRTQIIVSSECVEELEKKCAAFVRYDVYGTMGRGELPWPEKILLPIGLFCLFPARFVMGMTILVTYYVICRVCTTFLSPNREDDLEDYSHIGGWRRAVIVRTGRFFSRLLLFIFGFIWISETSRRNEVDERSSDESKCGDHSEDLERPGVIVSNHVSYIDILYHMSSSFPSFVAKKSVSQLPLVGLISKCLGCVYVQRELKPSDFKGVSGVVNERILEAHQDRSAPRIMLFPEGTTTNGDYLLPFKTGAFLAKTPVLPLIIRYPYQRFSVAWDSISGVRHLIFLLCQFVNYIEVTQLPVYIPSEHEMKDPKLYAENVRQLMACEGILNLSDVGLADKRVYLAALDGNLSMHTVLHQKDD